MRSEDGKSLSRLVFCDGAEEKAPQGCNSSLPLFAKVKLWLDFYFSGNSLPWTPPLSLQGTEFQLDVWRQIMQIPYGQTSTYGEIASRLKVKKASAVLARAVGAALSRNPIALIVPCHRVIGVGGALTGYRWGVEHKQALLALEGLHPASEKDCAIVNSASASFPNLK